MRRTYKERKYYCGEYMEVDIFPVHTHSKRRNARKKPTTEIQKHLNRKHSEGKLRRLLHTNFNQSDLFVTLTFYDDTLPATVEDAQRLLQNFLRRVKRVYGKMGLDVKYIYVLEYGTKHNRLHIHLVMSGGISREALTKLWGLGAVSSELLHFGKDGLAALARYLTKGSVDDDRLTWKRWSGSRNLEKSRVTEREGRLEQFVDGYSGFLYLDKEGLPEVAMHWEHRFNHMVHRYNEIYKVQIPNTTPHVCRHTYCSNMARAGMNPKTLQYLMGHSDIGVTMNTYTHLGLEDAQNEMVRLEELNRAKEEVAKAAGEKKPVTQRSFRAV